VKISSSDEFADLAESFNKMAERIARQFKSLAAAAEADQAVLSSVDTPRIVATCSTACAMCAPVTWRR
jgi:hypothetical protein